MKFLNAFKNVDLGSEALLKVAEIILVLVIGYFVIRTVIHFERKALRKTDRIDNSAVVMILRITRGLLWLMLILTIMSRLNVNMAPFVAVLGTAGAAIALALKDSLANVAGGIILLLTKPFVSGDEIQVAGYSGVVDYIDLMDTKLHTYAYEDVIIPNGTITNSVIVNCSRRDIRRVDGNFWIGLQSDITEAEKILKTNDSGPGGHPAPGSGSVHLDHRLFAGWRCVQGVLLVPHGAALRGEDHGREGGPEGLRRGGDSAAGAPF